MHVQNKVIRHTRAALLFWKITCRSCKKVSYTLSSSPCKAVRDFVLFTSGKAKDFNGFCLILPEYLKLFPLPEMFCLVVALQIFYSFNKKNICNQSL